MCTQNFFRTQKSRKCPLCQTDWTGNDFVGERAAITAPSRKRKSGSGAVARVQSPVADVEEGGQGEEAEEEDEDEDE